METYLLALAHFYLKPKSRLWDPDGNITNVTVTAVASKEERLTKDFSGEEADKRLSYLASVIDTGGWASRGVLSAPATNMIDTYYNEAIRTEDVMDTSATVAQSFDALISREDSRRKQEVTSQFQQAMAQAPATTPQPAQPSLTDETAEQILEKAEQMHLQANPYPSAMNQTVIQPLDQSHALKTAQQAAPPQPQAQSFPQPQAQAAPIPQPTPIPQKPATPTVSSDIMRLANNSSHLSVEALAHEAHRLEMKDSEEVVIDLR